MFNPHTSLAQCCSKSRPTFLAGHDMTVYAVKWNNIHQRIFLSASADWTLKLWEGDNPRPVMSFDLNNPVGDAAWSPHSATVFAAVTDDGKVQSIPAS